MIERKEKERGWLEWSHNGWSFISVSGTLNPPAKVQAVQDWITAHEQELTDLLTQMDVAHKGKDLVSYRIAFNKLDVLRDQCCEACGMEDS
jgi:hypothetical protein